MERVPTAWREDPNWRGPQGAGGGRLPAHAAAFPSRWVPADDDEPGAAPTSPSTPAGAGGWLGGRSLSGEWGAVAAAAAAGSQQWLRHGLGGWMGGAADRQQQQRQGMSKAAAAAAAEAESMGLRLVDYVRVPRVRPQL